MLVMPVFWTRLLVLLALLSCCAFAQQHWHLSDELRVSFLDIGQGDSIWIRTPHGRTVLIDGGPETTVLERLGEETSFWQQSIDLMILTHPDLDHLEGLLEVLKRYQVHRVMMTGAQHSSALYRAFFQELEDQQTEIIVPHPGQDWMIDEGVWLDVLAPLEQVIDQEVDNANDASVVVKLIYGSTSLLLTGDIEIDAEEALLMSGTDLQADLLKVGHHGSVTSSSFPFLQSVQAQQAVIQAGRENAFGHPHLETLLRFDELEVDWRSTAQEGTLRLISDGFQWRFLP